MATIPAPSSGDLALPESLCPRCQRPLVDQHGVGWCHACGYCRVLGEDQQKPAAPSPAPVAMLHAASGGFPYWAVGLVLSVALMVAGTWALSHYYHPKPMHRALWTTLQVAAGVLLMLIGQCYGLIRIAPEDGSMHAIDAIVPFRLYGMVFKRLPRMCAVLYLGGWGLALALSALIFIGGLSHWLNYIPKSRQNQSQWRGPGPSASPAMPALTNIPPSRWSWRTRSANQSSLEITCRSRLRRMTAIQRRQTCNGRSARTAATPLRI